MFPHSSSIVLGSLGAACLAAASAINLPRDDGVTTTVTVTAASSTSVVFSPGQPPATPPAENQVRDETEITTVTVTVPGHIYTATVYPCATPFPTGTTTLPYGTASGGEYLTDGNGLFGLDDPYGESAEACCNACFFELENCIRAWWYGYEGCVVSQPAVWNGTAAVANDPSSYNGTGIGVSAQCPGGSIVGLTYGLDTVDPHARSTGDMVGPCGVSYADL